MRSTNACGEMVDVVEGRAAADDRQRIGDELLDQLGRPRRGGDDRLRLGAEAQAEQRLVEGVGGTFPRRQFVQPQLFMLLAAQPVRLFGREQQRDGAVRPGEPAGSARVARPLVARADRHQSGFAQHHHVAHVVVGRADQVDDGEALRPIRAPPRRRRGSCRRRGRRGSASRSSRPAAAAGRRAPTATSRRRVRRIACR